MSDSQTKPMRVIRVSPLKAQTPTRDVEAALKAVHVVQPPGSNGWVAMRLSGRREYERFASKTEAIRHAKKLRGGVIVHDTNGRIREPVTATAGELRRKVSPKRG